MKTNSLSIHKHLNDTGQSLSELLESLEWRNESVEDFKESILQKLEQIALKFGWIRFGESFVIEPFVGLEIGLVLGQNSIRFEPRLRQMMHRPIELSDLTGAEMMVYLSPNAVKATLMIPDHCQHMPDQMLVSVKERKFLYPCSRIFIQNAFHQKHSNVDATLTLLTEKDANKKMVNSPAPVEMDVVETPKSTSIPSEPEKEEVDPLKLQPYKMEKIDRLELDDVGDDDFEFFKVSPVGSRSQGVSPAAMATSPATVEVPTPKYLHSHVFSPQYYSANTPVGLSPSPGFSPMDTSPAAASPENGIDLFKSPPPTSPFAKSSPNYKAMLTPKSTHSTKSNQKSYPESKTLELEFEVIDSVFCPVQWLPFDIKLDIFDEQSKYGAKGKWSYSPTTNAKAKPKFRIEKKLLDKHRQKPKRRNYALIKPEYLTQLFSTELPKFERTSIALAKDYLWNNSITWEFLYQLRIQEKLGEQAISECPSRDSTRVLELFYGIVNQLFPNHQSTMLTVDDLTDEKENEDDFAVYGTIKLRKKLPKEKRVELLSPPKLILQKQSKILTVNETSLGFWDKFNFSPAGGQKDVWWVGLAAFNNLCSSNSMDSYISTLTSMWRRCNLGQFEPCPLQTDRGYVKTVFTGIDTNLFAHTIYFYKDRVPFIAECISIQFFNSSIVTSPKYCILMVWNPFEEEPNSIVNICTIYSQLLYTIHKLSGCSMKLIRSKVILQIVTPKLIDNAFERTETNLQIENTLFGIYNRLPKAMSVRIATKAPVFQVDPELYEPKFFTKSPLIGSPLLLLEPDRIIHLCYGIAKGILIAKWVDSFGEFEDFERFFDVTNCAELLYNTTLKKFGKNGVFVRLIVSNVSGWQQSDILEWKQSMAMKFDDIKREEKSPSGSPKDVVVPTTPGSGYNTPQPALMQKPTEVIVYGSIASVTLVSYEHSSLTVDNDEIENNYSVKNEEWVSKHDHTLYVATARRHISWNRDFQPLASCYLLTQKPKSNQFKGIVCTLYLNWQSNIPNSIFAWTQKKSSAILKDIAVSYNQQRFTNQDRDWLFEEMTDYIQILDSAK